MIKSDTKFNKTLEEFVKLKEQTKAKVIELMENGILTPSMLEFDFEEGMEEIEVKYTIVYPTKEKEEIVKTYYVDFRIVVSDSD